ncbi:MAG: MFS transporter [Clostridia bacterium]|nr:MFS transporter [Clostridia bacterium]
MHPRPEAGVHRRPEVHLHRPVLAVYWFSLNFQTAALITLVLPRLILGIEESGHAAQLARLAALSAAVGMLVPPVVGLFSDRMRLRGGSRDPVIALGSLVNLAGLLWMRHASSLDELALALTTAVLGRAAATAAYQALIPDLVPASEWGWASGQMGAATLVGTIAGLAAGGALPPESTLGLMAVVVLVGALVTIWAGRHGHAEPRSSASRGEEAARAAASPAGPGGSVRAASHRDFLWAFSGRAFVMFGQSLLMTYVFYFFTDVVGVADASASTAAVAALAMAGAVVSSVVLGRASDRLPRPVPVFFAALSMAAAAAGFAWSGDARTIYAYGVLYGLGYGAFLSVDWALAIDTVPDRRFVARDLGVWGIASDLPGVLAPAAGGVILGLAAAPAIGYERLFLASAASLFLGAVLVLQVGRALRHAPLLYRPAAFAVAALLYVAGRVKSRLAVYGRPPADTRGLLVVANHTHDLDGVILPALVFFADPWRAHIRSAAAERLFQPGHLTRLAPKWLAPLLPGFNVGPAVRFLGALPLESDPRHRVLRSVAYEIRARHGDLAWGEVLSEERLREIARALARLRPGGRGADEEGLMREIARMRLSDVFRLPLGLAAEELVPLADLREPFRGELRALVRPRIARQFRAIEEALAEGDALYVTPEGRLTPDGRVHRMRELLLRVLPVARQVALAACAYDPFAPGKLAVHVRWLLLDPAWATGRRDDAGATEAPGGARRDDPAERVRLALAAARPITPGQVAAAALLGAPQGLTRDEWLAQAEALLAGLPQGAFLVPELVPPRRAASLEAAVEAVCAAGAARGGPLYLPCEGVRDDRFPHVPDILAHQAAMFHDTTAALRALAATGAAPYAAGEAEEEAGG